MKPRPCKRWGIVFNSGRTYQETYESRREAQEEIAGWPSRDRKPALVVKVRIIEGWK